MALANFARDVGTLVSTCRKVGNRSRLLRVGSVCYVMSVEVR